MDLLNSSDGALPVSSRLHGTEPPSAWVQRWSHLVPEQGVVLDVACGFGRHAHWFYKRKHTLVVIDRAQDAIKSIAAAIPAYACEAVVADIENVPWPLMGRQFDAVVVTNYLWRPLLPTLLNSLLLGGVLIYETFTQGNETVGKPSRPDFLLRPAELLAVCQDLRIVAFEDGFEEGTSERTPRFIQRIVAVREPSSATNLTESSSPLAAAPLRYKIN